MHLPNYFHMAPHMSVTPAVIFFSLRLGLRDFLVLHKDFNVILWFIFGTLNMMSHTWYIEHDVSYLQNCLVFIQKLQRNSPPICT